MEAEVGSQKLEARNGSLVHPSQCTAAFWGPKETTIVSEGGGKTNSPEGELLVQFPINAATRRFGLWNNCESSEL